MVTAYTGTGGTWITWCTGSATTSTSSTAVWDTWCTAGTSTATTADVWITWNATAERYVYEPPPPPTPEQVERRRIQVAETEARYKESESKRIAAEKRAEQLLIENLSLTQRLEYEKTKSFVVEGRAGKRFRIRHGRSGNIDVVDRTGRVEHRLCAHPRDLVPNCDTMLAQKLMLEDDEDSFIKRANRHHPIDGAAVVLPPLH